MSKTDKLSKLKEIVGEANVIQDSDQLKAYAIDGKKPKVIVSPKTIQEVSKVVAQANQQRLTIVPRGNGTKMGMGGVPKKIDIILEDYRNIKGQFDKFISIGMFEHVGKGLISTFMEKTKTMLKPGAIGLLHTIGKERDTPTDPWTMKYIFPGGHIPVLDHVIRAMGRTNLVPLDVENLRLHYAATLDEWAKRFEINTGTIEKMFDKKLVRTWRMYLHGSSAAFRWGDLRLYQILFTNGLCNSLPWTREHLYQSR